jgi:hypothetical protein
MKENKMIHAVQKTWKQMTPAAPARALALPPGPGERAPARRALEAAANPGSSAPASSATSAASATTTIFI